MPVTYRIHPAIGIPRVAGASEPCNSTSSMPRGRKNGRVS
jgi:hypothetical protein